jgi:hypothetical protein
MGRLASPDVLDDPLSGVTTSRPSPRRLGPLEAFLEGGLPLGGDARSE